MRLLGFYLLLGLGAGLFAGSALAAEGRVLKVRDAAAFEQAARSLRPGDTLELADGQWHDARLVLQGRGQAGRPIRLVAQTPGKVVLTGQSDLRLAGEYLEVSGLVFRDGWAPGNEVVSFRTSPAARAVHSRVSAIVIDGYNKPDRDESDHWVALYGHDNRFDHSQLVGKTNRGTTLVVVRDPDQGLDNRHLIDHNWFGPRPGLGANGGETIRVGTSHDSLSDSHTRVEENWFEGCDGEVEIVSNKSGGNVYRGNVFYRSRGALVLRHGSGNLVEGNVFLGGGKAHTGGVRIINGHQTVRGNYFENLAGTGFAAALSVMYGAVDAPKNRYARVEHAVIERNTWVAPRQLLLGAGRDAERDAAPIDSRFTGNLITNGATDPLQVEGDLGGIAFAGNLQSPQVSPGFPAGVSTGTVTLRRAASGLQVPATPLGEIGAPADLAMVAREATGVSWYPKQAEGAPAREGRTVLVTPGQDALVSAVHAAVPGDRLQLAAGRYDIDEVLAVAAPLAIEGPATGTARILFSRPTLFRLLPGGALRLSHLLIDGSDAPDEAGNAVVRAAPGSGAAHYTLEIEHATLEHLDGNRHFDVLSAGKGTLADLVALRDVQVRGASGAVVSAAAETDDGGTYNAERVEIVDSRFTDIGGAVVDLYRGGTDESTFGPSLSVTGSRFERVGRQLDAALRLHGVQHAVLVDNVFRDSAPVRFSHSVGRPVLQVAANQYLRTPAPVFDIPAEAP